MNLKNLKQMLEKTASEAPQQTAIVLGSRRVSYRELDETSNRIANALISLGIKKGDHVAILLSRTPEWVINCFGVLKAGAAAVLLDSGAKAPELEPQLRESDSKILITEERFSPLLSSVLPNVPLLKQVLKIDTDPYKRMLASGLTVSPSVNIDGEDEAILFYTLGVLGKNKGVVHTHSSFMSIIPIVVQKFELERDDVVLGLLPFNYLLGFGLVVLMPIWRGATIAILPHFSSKSILETIVQEKATMLIGVPASFNAMALIDEETIKSYDFSSLRAVLCAGAKSSALSLEMLENKFHLIACEIYGLTELIIVTIGAIRDRKLGTAGKPLAELRVLDKNGKEVPRGTIGEAVARAPWMMREYYKSPELTARVLKDGWFHTGDLVKLDEDGYLEFIEKTSSIIVPSGGVKILPAAVEEVLLKHPAVAETACIGVLDDYKGQIPTAFIVLKQGQSATPDEIRDFSRQSLSEYKVPKQIRFVDSLPRTGSGQIDRKRLSVTKEN
ncbi:MAG TPA: AMP-binding protein [Dehalococcoidia bacterium]|nr:AMP-binding protein [Dehalococcoidia bacterium]